MCVYKCTISEKIFTYCMCKEKYRDISLAIYCNTRYLISHSPNSGTFLKLISASLFRCLKLSKNYHSIISTSFSFPEKSILKKKINIEPRLNLPLRFGKIS